MPESFMYSNEANIKLVIDPSKVKGGSAKFNPTLIIPITFHFQPKNALNPEDSKARSCYLVGLELKLKIGDSILSSSSALVNREVYFNNEIAINLEFPLDKNRIETVEKERHTGLEFTISCLLMIALHADVKLANNSSLRVISNFTWANGDIKFQVSQSDWIGILPELGYKAFELVEIPSANQLISEEYALSLNELNLARQYLMQGDYDKVVAHCRSALEPIRGKYPNLKKYVKESLSAEWLDAVNNATLEWLDKMFKFQADITNKTHHVPSIGHFSRREAEAIYLLTVSTISIGGSIEPLHTKS